MKILNYLKHKFFELLPPTIFFFIAFSLLMITKQAMLRDYGVSWPGFGLILFGALLAGKAVLLADKLPFMNWFSNRPLIYNTVWKSFIYVLVMLLVQYLELKLHHTVQSANRNFWLGQMWLSLLFFMYCCLGEMIRIIGRDKVLNLFFGIQSNKN